MAVALVCAVAWYFRKHYTPPTVKRNDPVITCSAASATTTGAERTTYGQAIAKVKADRSLVGFEFYPDAGAPSTGALSDAQAGTVAYLTSLAQDAATKCAGGASTCASLQGKHNCVTYIKSKNARTIELLVGSVVAGGVVLLAGMLYGAWVREQRASRCEELAKKMESVKDALGNTKGGVVDNSRREEIKKFKEDVEKAKCPSQKDNLKTILKTLEDLTQETAAGNTTTTISS